MVLLIKYTASIFEKINIQVLVNIQINIHKLQATVNNHLVITIYTYIHLPNNINTIHVWYMNDYPNINQYYLMYY